MRLLQTWRYNIRTALVLVYFISMLQRNYRKISKIFYININTLRNSLPVKSRENKNLNNKKSHGVIKSTSKKETMIVGDSMIKYVNGHLISRVDSAEIRCHPGTTRDDIIDYVRPTAGKKPDMIIIHTGTNDIQNKVNMLQKVRKVITTIK